MFSLSVLALAFSLYSARTASAQSKASVCDPPTQFFPQLIDHFSGNTTTFPHQYQLNTKYFKEGGPIFLFQGEESPYITCAETTVLEGWAQETGGIVASLEHRYFGESLPYGPNDTYTPQGFVNLTLENVMADAATFVAFIKKNVTGAANSKVIAASGSYGSFLVTNFRQNHPESFDAVLATGGPLKSLAIQNNPEKFYWWNFLDNIWTNSSAAASKKIKAAFDSYVSLFNAGNYSAIADATGLCYAPNSTDDYLLLTQVLTLPFLYAPQLDYAAARDGFNPVAYPFEMLKAQIVNDTSSNPLNTIKLALDLWYKPLGFQCYDFNTIGGAGLSSVESTPFTWINCNYLPLSTNDIPNGTIFAPNPDFFETLLPAGCEAFQAPPLRSETVLQNTYKFAQSDIVNSTRIIFSEGGLDPATAVGPVPFQSEDPNVSKYILTADMPHQEDLWAPTKNDRASVVALRATELEILKGWIGYGQKRSSHHGGW